jgi:hypothetical protein
MALLSAQALPVRPSQLPVILCSPIYDAYYAVLARHMDLDKRL